MPKRQVRRSARFEAEAKAMFPIGGSAEGRASYALFDDGPCKAASTAFAVNFEAQREAIEGRERNPTCTYTSDADLRPARFLWRSPGRRHRRTRQHYGRPRLLGADRRGSRVGQIQETPGSDEAGPCHPSRRTPASQASAVHLRPSWHTPRTAPGLPCPSFDLLALRAVDMCVIHAPSTPRCDPRAVRSARLWTPPTGRPLYHAVVVQFRGEQDQSHRPDQQAPGEC